MEKLKTKWFKRSGTAIKDNSRPFSKFTIHEIVTIKSVTNRFNSRTTCCYIPPITLLYDFYNNVEMLMDLRPLKFREPGILNG